MIKKSIFSQMFMYTMLAILFSFLVMGMLMYGLLGDYLTSLKEDDLTYVAESLADFTVKLARRNPNYAKDKYQMNVDALKLKCVDTFAPFGPCIDTEVDPLHARVRSWVNGELRQDGTTADMLFNAAYIIELFTSYMTLYPGDVISMGTPPGAGAVHPGDVIGVEIDDIGLLENPAIGI